ncbi:hypothetical protein [Malaciobacter molluscorum]|nr:hypothetical protein [Malaciobacter molluscorum]
MQDWQVYLIMFVIVFSMLVGKKLIFFHDDKNIKKDEDDKS